MIAIKTGFVYFVQSGDEGLIKIGFATDVRARIKAMQTGNPEVLRLLAVIPDCTMDDEKWLHRRYRKACIWNEWFAPVRSLMRLITDHWCHDDEEHGPITSCVVLSEDF